MPLEKQKELCPAILRAELRAHLGVDACLPEVMRELAQKAKELLGL